VTSVPYINGIFNKKVEYFDLKKHKLRGEIELDNLKKRKIALEIELLHKDLQSKC